MKLNKKFLASFMALTMAAAPMSAYAAPYSINGTGTITILETEIYNVVLPTDKSIDFNVDPYGILTMDPGATLDDVVSKAAGIVTSSATAVINKSSVPIDVNMQFYFDQSASAPASNAAVSLASLDVVKAGNADLYLEVLPLSGATLEAGVPVATGAAITPADIGVPVSNKAVTLSDTPLSFTDYGQELSGVPITVTGSAASVTGTELKFSLKDVSYAYDVVTGGSANAVTAAAVLSEGALSYDYRNVYAFAITGYASPASKDLWLAIQEADSDIKLTLKFTLSKGEKDESKSAYAFIAQNGTMYIGIQSNTNITDGGMTDYASLEDIKIGDTTITPYGGKLFVGNFALTQGSYRSGDVITFTYDNVKYKVTVPTS